MSPALAGGNEAAATRPAAGQAAPSAPVTGRAGRRWPTALARYLPVLLSMAAMTVAGVWGLARDSSMGNDEVATRWAALLSLRELAHLLNNVDAVHGLYYLIMHAWAAVGSTPTVLRIPSVIAMAVGAGLVATLARKLTGSGWAALFAGLVMALTPTITYYAQTARSYAMVLACVVAATLVLVHALEAETGGKLGLPRPDPSRPLPDPRHARRWWVAYAALVVLSSYLNEMALLMLAAHAVTVLLTRCDRRIMVRWFTTAVIAGVLVLPLLALSIKERGAIGWVPRPGLEALRILFHDYFGATTIVPLLVLACAVIAVLPPGRPRQPASDGAGPAGSAGPAAVWWHGGISLPSVAAPLLVIPAALLLVESEIVHPLYVDRYVLYGEAGAALLAGAGVYRVGRWATQRLTTPGVAGTLVAVPGVVLCVLALVLQLGPYRSVRTPQSRAYDFGGPSRYVGAHARKGDGVLYFGTFFRKAELGYPQDYTKVADFGEAVTPMRAGNYRGADKSFAQTLPLMLRYQRIWVLGLRPSLQAPAGLMRNESKELLAQFRLAYHERFRGMSLTLWVRR